MTLLPTAVVKLVTPNATLPVRVLVDSGSDQSYIRGEIVEALGLDFGGSAKTMTILMHGGQSRTTRVKKANFQMSTRGRKTNVTLHATCNFIELTSLLQLVEKLCNVNIKFYLHRVAHSARRLLSIGALYD